MATQERPAAERRDPAKQEKQPGGRRESDRYWTVPEIAVDLRMTERSVWRKFLNARRDRPYYLPYYNFDGEIRIAADDYTAWKTRCFQERTTA